uniref:RRM domain-containing protein n=2 Tax=Monopterus albus TaxID=43700 RepID=A0A3Q3K717_MONAL|nr:peroxisome proliferator-activated receptor gamma coactivator-related protein 1 [Monopterus albus]
MAARWGAGEETLTACNIESFPMDTLDMAAGLSPGETLEALQSCIDPSILSIFEDTPTAETKGLDDDSEAMLLSALTEILDNADDENLSPFDMLPDSDLLSSQNSREHSPISRLLCLSRSPPEKDTLCSRRPLSTGKSIPRMQAGSLQRSDGEEIEEGSLWEEHTLPFPVTIEQEGEDGVPVSLGDLVRHMHPYCMTICVENDNGEQILPEGGILFEVLDQAENGEPILTIPDMGLLGSLPLKEHIAENDQKVLDEAEEQASDRSDLIVVDDEDVTVSKAPLKVTSPATPGLCSDVTDKMIIQKQKEKMKEKRPSHRKKKKKCKEQCRPELVEGRVLRSTTGRKMAQEAPKKPEKRPVKEEKKNKVPKVPLTSTLDSSSVKPKQLNSHQTEREVTSTILMPEMDMQAATCVSPRQDTAQLNASPEKRHSSYSPNTLSSQQPDEMLKKPAPALEKLEGSPEAPTAVLPPLPSESPAAAANPITSQVTPPVSEALPPVAPIFSEPKPKSLSLEEYRCLRQQKKPPPVVKQDNNSTKWPSLPEPPKELPPIPCLPEPSPEGRRPNRQAAKKEVSEVRPAWQPKGPAAPPTPEALLVPPSYMVASSSKVSAPISKPQQIQKPSKPVPLQKPSVPAPNSVKNLPIHQEPTAQPVVPCVPQISEPPPSFIQATQPLMSSSDGKHGVNGRPQIQPVPPNSVELTKTTSMYAPSAPEKTTAVSQTVPGASAATSLRNPNTSETRSCKPTPSITQLCSSPVLCSSEFQGPVVFETKGKPTTAVKPQRPKSPTQELIEAFTSEIGIEAADVTSLLEQFEETQAKEKQYVPEVSGRAAAVGSSSFELAPENTVVERVRANDLSSTAALTPPATPPHHMWKALALVALLKKSKATEASKSIPSKVIQIEAQPLPSAKSRSKPTSAAATVAPDLACRDHDYCFPSKGASAQEPGKRWNVKQQSFITIKPIKKSTATTTETPPAALAPSVQFTPNGGAKTKPQDFPPTEPLDHRTDGLERSSVLETPDASPARQETDSTVRRGPSGGSYCGHAASNTPSPRSSPRERTGGRSRKRSHCSSSPMSSGSESDSQSSRSRSRSHSPSRKRYRPRHGRSESSSSSSSRSSSRSSISVSCSPPRRRRRYSYSSSRSGSWSRSRSWSRSPQRRAWQSRSRRLYSPYREDYGHRANTNLEEVKRRKEKATEERRVVYVGRIRGTMTQKELRERFSFFGEIEDCTLHFRDHGDNYGFVTYYSTKDAFTAIENGGKLRKPDELPFDLCFGGRRQFCQSSYSDLDSNREYDPLSAKGKFHALDFDTLLKQAQQSLKR